MNNLLIAYFIHNAVWVYIIFLFGTEPNDFKKPRVMAMAGWALFCFFPFLLIWWIWDLHKQKLGLNSVGFLKGNGKL
jgi:hypothetical protein